MNASGDLAVTANMSMTLDCLVVLLRRKLDKGLKHSVRSQDRSGPGTYLDSSEAVSGHVQRREVLLVFVNTIGALIGVPHSVCLNC